MGKNQDRAELGMMLKTDKRSTQAGFSLVEVMVSLFLASILLSVMYSVVQNAMSLNAKANLRSEASALAFKKVQDYINLDFASVPIGDDVTSYEVEDFRAEAEALGLRNVTATVYSEPESVVSTSTEVVTDHTQSISADTAYVAGSEISSSNQHDATGDWYTISRIRDNNYSNYTYSRYANDPDTLASPSIDLGSAQDVDTIRMNWFYCGYGASDFRIEAKNSSPTTNSGWTTIVSGLSDNGISCTYGDHPQDIDVSSNPTAYRYWRLYFVNSEHDDYAVISELEAFSAAVPADTVEQHGSDASSTPGALYFSDSDLEMSEDGVRGHQSLGMIFDDINTPQGATINNAYINFTADEAHSSAVSLLVKAADVDNAVSWNGNFAVDNAVDGNSADGSLGTTASTTWNPAAWSVGESGSDTQVDVTAIVQEIVDRVGWLPDNAMALTVQYISGAGKRVAERYPAPQLVIDWSETTTTTPGDYVDGDSDGDADNPTLIRLTSVIEYDAFGGRHRVEYSTFVRRHGVGD